MKICYIEHESLICVWSVGAQEQCGGSAVKALWSAPRGMKHAIRMEGEKEIL